MLLGETSNEGCQMLEIEQKDKEKNILFPLEKSALIQDIAIGKIILL